MHAKDSQHTIAGHAHSRRGRRARVIAIFQFCFFPPFFRFSCSPGVHTQRFTLAGPAGTFVRATTFVSGVNFRSGAQPLSRESRVFPCRRRKNQLGINPQAIQARNKIAPCKSYCLLHRWSRNPEVDGLKCLAKCEKKRNTEPL